MKKLIAAFVILVSFSAIAQEESTTEAIIGRCFGQEKQNFYVKFKGNDPLDSLVNEFIVIDESHLTSLNTLIEQGILEQQTYWQSTNPFDKSGDDTTLTKVENIFKKLDTLGYREDIYAERIISFIELYKRFSYTDEKKRFAMTNTSKFLTMLRSRTHVKPFNVKDYPEILGDNATLARNR